MAVARSPHARARLRSIEGGLNRSNFDVQIRGFGEGGGALVPRSTMHPVFANEFVNYFGQPVAAVFADDPYSAEDKLEDVNAEYEPLKPVMTIDESLSSEPLHPGTNSNIISEDWMGEEFVTPSHDFSLEDEFYMDRVLNNPMETHGLIASFDGSRLTVYISTQSVYSIRYGLSSALGLDEGAIRVIQADTGGAFGSKSALYPEYVMAAYASMKYRRPVKWIGTRTEEISASQPGRGVRGKIKIYAKNSGKIVGLRGEITTDAGAYGGTAGSSSPYFIARQLSGPYGIANAHVLARAVMTNKPPQGPYRGAGRPEAAFFINRMMDMLADRLGLGEEEVRIANATDEHFTSPLGIEINASRPFFEEALAKLDWSKRKARSGGNAGLCFYVLMSSVMPGESARVRVKDGKISVWLGGNQHGQAHTAFVKALVREELGVPMDIVTLYNGDSDMLSEGIGTWGSRTAIVGGAAVVAASRKIKEQVKEEYGRYTPELLLAGEYDAELFDEQDMQVNSFGATVATIEIDEFGRARVPECAICHDVGRALTREVVENQLVGGALQGISQVLYESVVHARNGELLTKDLFDAGMPNIEATPKFDVSIIEHPSIMPHHAKGVGEAGTVGMPPAVVRAIEKASGKRIKRTPVSMEELIGCQKPAPI